MSDCATETGPRQAKRAGEIRFHDTTVSVWEEHVDRRAMRLVFRSLLARLRARGWHVEKDPRAAHHTSIADNYWVGTKGGLRMAAETAGRTASVMFYQDLLHSENPNGGRYDSGKLARMARELRTVRLQCLVEMAAVARRLVEHGYTPRDGVDANALLRTITKCVERRFDTENPLAEFDSKWGASRFERDASGWPTAHEYDRDGRNRDGDRRPLRNGEVRFLRVRGRLQRATVYTNLNSMWMAVCGGEVTYVSGYELFSCDRPDLEDRRFVAGQEDRLRRELEKELKAKNYRRVAVLGKVLASLYGVRP